MEMGEELDRLRFNKMYFKKDDEELKEFFSSMSRDEMIESQKVFDNIYFKSASLIYIRLNRKFLCLSLN